MKLLDCYNISLYLPMLPQKGVEYGKYKRNGK